MFGPKPCPNIGHTGRKIPKYGVKHMSNQLVECEEIANIIGKHG